jgi:hypothetical protein
MNIELQRTRVYQHEMPGKATLRLSAGTRIDTVDIAIAPPTYSLVSRGRKPCHGVS